MSGNEGTDPGKAASKAGEWSPDSGDVEPRPYLVLWGDAVAPRELGRSLLLAVPVALGAFLLAQQVLSGSGDEQVVDGYALLVGLAACVVTGAVCAKLFAPKRVFVDSGSNSARPDLPPEFSSPEAVADLPEQYVAEMREIGLYDPDGPSSDAAVRPGEPVRRETQR